MKHALAVVFCSTVLASGAAAQTGAAPGTPSPAARAQAPTMAENGLPPVPPPLPHPTTEAQLREFLALTDAPDRVHKEMVQATEGMRRRAPAYVPAVVWDEIETGLKTLDIVQIYLPYYQAYISEQDMTALLAFYRTEAGKHYAATQATLLTGLQAKLAVTAQNIVQSTVAKHKDEIEAARKQAEQQQAPGSTPAPKP